MVDRSDLLNDYARIIDELRAENAELRKDREKSQEMMRQAWNQLDESGKYGMCSNATIDECRRMICGRSFVVSAMKILDTAMSKDRD